MMIPHLAKRGLLLVALSLSSHLAHAGAAIFATVSYAPAAANVPALSEWTPLALASLVALIAYRSLRQRLHGQPLAALFMTLAVGVLALVGGHFGSQALADILTDASMSNPAGGSTTVTCGSNTSNVVNNTSVPLKIISVTGSATTGGSTCPGLPTVPPAGSCTVVLSACVG